MKPTLGLATFRGTQVPMNEAGNENESLFEDVERLAQIDFILVSRAWKNAVTDCIANPKVNVESDHFPMVCISKVKFAARKQEKRKNIQFWDIEDEDVVKAFNCKASELVKGEEPKLGRLMKAIGAVAEAVPKIVRG